MPPVAENEYGAMQQLNGLSNQIVDNFRQLRQGLYSNVNIPNSDDLHVDPRIRALMEGFRDKVRKVLFIPELSCKVGQKLV